MWSEIENINVHTELCGASLMFQARKAQCSKIHNLGKLHLLSQMLKSTSEALKGARGGRKKCQLSKIIAFEVFEVSNDATTVHTGICYFTPSIFRPLCTVSLQSSRVFR